MKKILFFDTETTGIDSTLHSLIQIAGIIDIDGEVKETFSFNVKPHPEFEIDNDALKINKITRQQMETFPEMNDVRKCLTRMFSKYICNVF